MRGPKNVTINGHKYVIGLLPTTVGTETWVRLLRLLGPALAEGIDGLAGKAKLQGMPLNALSGFLREASTRMNTQDITELRRVFGDISTQDGTKLTLEVQELAFCGETKEMYDWLKEAVEHNFQDFFTSGKLAWSSIGSTPDLTSPAKG